MILTSLYWVWMSGWETLMSWKNLVVWKTLPVKQTWQAGALEVKRDGKVDTVVEQGKAWRVKYHSTVWPARSTTWICLSPGDEVKVVGREGLVLSIEPLETIN